MSAPEHAAVPHPGAGDPPASGADPAGRVPGSGPAAGERAGPDGPAGADEPAETAGTSDIVPAGTGDVEPALPEPVRQRVVALAAAALAALPQDELPVPLRRVAKWAPNRRARLGGTVIATHLTGDPLFRQRIAQQVTA